MSTIVFVLAYLALMVPTYVLPYLGSNSTIFNGVAVGTGFGMTPMWWAHVWCLAMLVVIAWLRGARIGKGFLPFLSLAAGLFDLTPVLSVIPFVPTVFHVITLALGIKGTEVADEKAVGTANKRGLVAAAVATVAAVAGVVSFAMPKPQAVTPAAQQASSSGTKPAQPAVEAPKATESAPKASPAPAPVAESAPAPASEPKVSEAVPAKPKPKAAPPQIAKPSAPKSPSGNDGDQKTTGTTVRYMKL